MKLCFCTKNVLKLYAIGECWVYCVDSILVCGTYILYIYIIKLRYKSSSLVLIICVLINTTRSGFTQMVFDQMK